MNGVEMGQQGKQPQEKVRGSQFWRREEKSRPKLTIRIPFIQRPSENKYQPKGPKEAEAQSTILFQADPGEVPFTGDFNGIPFVDGHTPYGPEDQAEIEDFNTWPELTDAAQAGTLEDESGFHPQ